MVGVYERFRNLRDSAREEIHHFWQQGAVDPFRWLNFVLMFSGLRGDVVPKNLKHLWKFFALLAVYQHCLVIIEAVLQARSMADYLCMVWYAALAAIFALCWVKNGVLRLFWSKITMLQEFIIQRNNNSGDSQFDALSRHKFHQTVRNMAATVVVVAIVNQTILLIPNAQRDRFFGLPCILEKFDSTTAAVVKFLCILMLPITWNAKYFSCTLITTTLLLGIRTELEIVAHGYRCCLDRVLATVRKEVGGIDAQRKLPFWKHLKAQIFTITEQHIETLRNLTTLRTITEIFFMIKYYFALAYIGSMTFVSVNERLSFSGFGVYSSVAAYLMEIGWWCHLVDSFEDVNEEIEFAAQELALRLKYTEEYRADYVGARTALVIVAINARNSGQFECPGWQNISRQLFIDLVDLSYKFLTFLMNFQ